MVSTLIEPPSPGDQPARATRVIDARTRGRRDRSRAVGNHLERVIRVTRELFGLASASNQLAELAVGLRDCIEAAVEQRVRNAGLLLHTLGQRDEGAAGRADIEDQIGLERDHAFQIGGVAAARDTPDLGARADLRQHIHALFRPVGARPAKQQLGRERIKQDRGRRAGREHARDFFRYRQRAAGRVGDRCRM